MLRTPVQNLSFPWSGPLPFLPQAPHGVMRSIAAVLATTLFFAVNLCLLLYAAEKPAVENVSSPSSSNDAPIKLKLETTQNIYSSRQGLMLKMEIIATDRAKVCLAEDIMSQLQVKVSKSGVNRPLKPLVVNDNSAIYNRANMNKWLEPGDKLTYHLNLKRLKFTDGSPWTPGEYSASAIYMLCPQTKDKPETEFSPLSPDEDSDGDDIPVKSTKPVWFMIMS